MNVLEEKAKWLADDLAQIRGMAGFTAATDFLDFLMEMLKEFLPVLIKCFMSPAEAVAAMNDPNAWQEFRLRRFLRGQIRDERMERKLLEPLTRSFLKLGKSITADEYTSLQNAA